MIEVSRNTYRVLALVLFGAGGANVAGAQIMYPAGSVSAGGYLLFSVSGLVCTAVGVYLMYLEPGDREKAAKLTRCKR